MRNIFNNHKYSFDIAGFCQLVNERKIIYIFITHVRFNELKITKSGTFLILFFKANLG